MGEAGRGPEAVCAGGQGPRSGAEVRGAGWGRAGPRAAPQVRVGGDNQRRRGACRRGPGVSAGWGPDRPPPGPREAPARQRRPLEPAVLTSCQHLQPRARDTGERAGSAPAAEEAAHLGPASARWGWGPGAQGGGSRAQVCPALLGTPTKGRDEVGQTPCGRDAVLWLAWGHCSVCAQEEHECPPQLPRVAE